MRAADDGLRPLVVANLRSHLGSPVHHQPIETALTASGVPDLNCCWRGRETWVECKATEGWAVGLSEFQVGWLVTRIRAGGRGFVLTRRRHDGGPRRGPPADDLYVHEGARAAELRAGGLRGVPALLVTAGGPGRWDWEAVGRAVL